MSPSPGHQVADQPALGTQGDTVASVLDIAPDDDATILGKSGRAHREVGVRRIGTLGQFTGATAQRLPVDVHVTP